MYPNLTITADIRAEINGDPIHLGEDHVVAPSHTVKIGQIIEMLWMLTSQDVEHVVHAMEKYIKDREAYFAAEGATEEQVDAITETDDVNAHGDHGVGRGRFVSDRRRGS